MFDSHIKRIKAYFALAWLMIIAFIVAGSVFIERSSVVHDNYTRDFLSYLTYLKYKARLGGDKGGTALSKAFGFFEGVSTYQSKMGRAEFIPILVYHGIITKADESGINVTVDNFSDQMFALKKAGYTTITADELHKYLRGEISLPEKSFMITFDDGRLDSVKNGDPVLKALGFKATIFVISKYSADNPENRYYISENEIKNMTESGRWDVQSHTHDGHGLFEIDNRGSTGHFFGNKRWVPEESRLETDQEFNERILADAKTVKEKLENLTKKEIIGFAVPFGDFGQERTNYKNAREASLSNLSKFYPLIFYQYEPGDRYSANYFLREKKDDPFFLVKRIDTKPTWKGNEILEVMEKVKPKALPYSDAFENDKGWIVSWGNADIGGGKLVLEPSYYQSGAATILDGTRIWKNYKVRALVEVPLRNGLFIWVRYKNDANNAACNFGRGFVHIEETVNGESRVMKGVRDPGLVIPDGEFEVEVRVTDRNIGCFVSGQEIVSSQFLNSSLKEGGIGFKTWDTDLGESKLIIKKISVEPI